MRIAVAIIASRNPDVLKQTVQYFSSPYFFLFVHVDQKYDIEAFSFLDALENCHVIPDRVNVRWGGFSMVKVEALLMRAALNEGRFDYFMTMSDDMLPLQPPTTFINMLLDQGRWVRGQPNACSSTRDRYQAITNFDIPALNPHTSGSRVLDITDILNFDKIRAVMASGKYPVENLFHWSQWKIFDFSAVSGFLSVYEDNILMRLSFECSIIPDEMYVPTVIFNQGYYFGKDFVFTDFTRRPAPYTFTDIDDLVGPSAQRYMFIRKVNSSALAAAQISGLLEQDQEEVHYPMSIAS